MKIWIIESRLTGPGVQYWTGLTFRGTHFSGVKDDAVQFVREKDANRIASRLHFVNVVGIVSGVDGVTE